MMRRTIATTLVITTTWISLWAVAPGWAQAPPVHDHYAQAANRLEVLLGVTKNLRSQIDRSQFALDALLEELDFDAENILEFVSLQIYFEQYKGLLRGPQGTLMSRAGNALDQSVLLAKLLQDSGLEARIAHGRLSTSQTERLLGQLMKQRKPRPGPFKDPVAVENILVEIASLAGNPGADPVKGYWNAVAEHSQVLGAELLRLDEIGDSILDQLSGAGTDISITSRDELAKEAVDYYWVEFRDGPSTPWKAAHPALADEKPFDISQSNYFKDEVPQELLHKFTLRATVETAAGGQRTEKAIMDEWTRPAANLAGKTISFSTLPTGLLSVTDPLADHRATIEASSYVVPIFEGRSPQGAMVFDLDGNVAPLEALTASGEFVKQISKKAANAVSAISALGSSDQDSGLSTGPKTTGVWLDFELTSPNKEVRSVRRHLLETTESGQILLGQQLITEDRLQQKAMAFFLQQRAIQVSTGTQPQSLAMDRLLERTEKHVTEILSSMSDSSEEKNPTSPSMETLADLNGSVDVWSSLWRFHALEITPTQENPRLSYRSQPAVSSVQRGIDFASTTPVAFSQTDLITSQRRSFRLQGDQLYPSLENTIRAGILESRLEGPSQSSQNTAQKSFSAYAALASAPDSWVVLAPGDTTKIARLRSDPATRQILRHELEVGNYLVIPETPDDGADVWWRIDPHGGETLAMGIGPGGYAGINLAEFLVLVSVGLTLLGAYIGIADCKASYTGDELWCCLIDVLFFGSLFMLFTMALAFVSAAVGPPAMIVAEIEAGSISAAAYAAAESIVALLIYDIPLGVIGISGILPKICDPKDL